MEANRQTYWDATEGRGSRPTQPLPTANLGTDLFDNRITFYSESGGRTPKLTGAAAFAVY
jgi:hypothetical protein